MTKVKMAVRQKVAAIFRGDVGRLFSMKEIHKKMGAVTPSAKKRISQVVYRLKRDGIIVSEDINGAKRYCKPFPPKMGISEKLKVSAEREDWMAYYKTLADMPNVSEPLTSATRLIGTLVADKVLDVIMHPGKVGKEFGIVVKGRRNGGSAVLIENGAKITIRVNRSKVRRKKPRLAKRRGSMFVVMNPKKRKK